MLRAHKLLVEAAEEVAESVGVEPEAVQDRGVQALHMEAGLAVMDRRDRRRAELTCPQDRYQFLS